MDNEKSLYRKIKREKKRAGNRGRRNFFKRQLRDSPEETHWDEYDVTYNSTKEMNGKYHDNKRKREPDTQEVVDQIKERAAEFARSHATENAKSFYTLGKRDAASTFLAMVRDDGAVSAIQDVAKEILRHDPGHPHAKWILENDEWKS